ncbi:MAG: site-2 protease family protein [Oscillospiraceae bacterium]|jgi:Zn-dependent protease
MSFWNMFDWGQVLTWALRAAAVLICIMIHEVSHGAAALLLGDPTAKSQHRLSLNPLRHLDPFGMLMMLFLGFGWAKPVPVDMRYFKHPKSGMALTALAGPLSNFVLASLMLFVSGLLLRLSLTAFLAQLIGFFLQIAILSIGLGIFNLIPFPPLDGFKIVLSFLPDRIYYRALQYERYGILVLIAVFWLGGGGRFLSAAISGTLRVLCAISGFPYVLLA